MLQLWKKSFQRIIFVLKLKEIEIEKEIEKITTTKHTHNLEDFF